MKRIRWEDRGEGCWLAEVAPGVTAWIMPSRDGQKLKVRVWVGHARCDFYHGPYDSLCYAKRVCREWITRWLRLEESDDETA